MGDFYNKHYICIDADGNIIKGFSNAFEKPQDGNICINERGERHFELFGQINPPLRNMQGVCLYQYINGKVIAKSPEEIEAEIPKPESLKPSLKEQVRTLTEAVLEMAGEYYG